MKARNIVMLKVRIKPYLCPVLLPLAIPHSALKGNPVQVRSCPAAVNLAEGRFKHSLPLSETTGRRTARDEPEDLQNVSPKGLEEGTVGR